MDILYFDMDNVMSDFTSAEKLSISRNPGIAFPQSQLKFFENLEPVPGSIEAYNKLKSKYNVKILTRPSVHNPLCYMEKRLWVEKHLGFDECVNLIISCDKTLLKGRYLIDDMKQAGLFKPEWEHIHYGSARFPNWGSILYYLLK